MAETYNVFISWSGDRSKRVAAALREWLPMVVQTAEPWMSEEDIEKGSRGLDDIGKALAAMGVGIICLTPENLERPWILFEAGALSKALGDKTRVCPYLFGDLRPENVKLPLGMFQATRAVKDDTRKLVATVNRVLEGKVPLMICKGAWQSPNWKSRRMTRRANGLSGVVEELPPERAAFRPARTFCPNQ